MSKSLDVRTRVLAAMLSDLSCRQPAIRFGVSAPSAIRCRTMERVQGDAKPKAVVARPALDAPGPSCGRPFARWSMRPRTSCSKSSGRRWPRDAYGKLRRAVALLSPPQDHAQKDRARHEQDRPDIVKRREPGSMASWNLDPDRHVFNTATPDLDQHLPPVRMGAETAKGSESAFLMCTPKQRPSSPDCT
jgi:hypothetical protein